MAWTALSFSVGQVLTAAQMNNLQANFAAMAAGDVGAPDIEFAAHDFTIATNSSQSISSAGTWTPAVGIYMVQDVTSGNSLYQIYMQIYDGGTWRGPTTNTHTQGVIITDGTNVRFGLISGTLTFYYHKY